MTGQGKTRKLCNLQEELMQLWWAGKNDCRIADEVGCTSSAIWQWRQKNGLPKNAERGRQWRKEG